MHNMQASGWVKILKNKFVEISFKKTPRVKKMGLDSVFSFIIISKLSERSKFLSTGTESEIPECSFTGAKESKT